MTASLAWKLSLVALAAERGVVSGVIGPVGNCEVLVAVRAAVAIDFSPVW